MIVALGQFNSSFKHKEILPKKFGQSFIDKPHELHDSKGAKRQSKPLFAQKKSLKKNPTVQHFAAQNSFPVTQKISQLNPSNSNNPSKLTLITKASNAAESCCMMMSA